MYITDDSPPPEDQQPLIITAAPHVPAGQPDGPGGDIWLVTSVQRDIGQD
jgi:hypothetical protein